LNTPHWHTSQIYPPLADAANWEDFKKLYELKP
jgi:hypothetical protein